MPTFDRELAVILERYVAEREASDSAAGPQLEHLCRYCGKFWRKWAGSKLDGHAQCIVSDGFKRYVADVYRHHPGLTYYVLGDALGVTPAVIRSWIMPIRGSR